MKKIKTIVLAMAILVLAVCFMVIAGGNGYKPQGYTVGITSKLIVPSIHPGTTTNWVASTAYSEGAYLKAYTNNSDRYWFAVSAGTSDTSYPTLSYTNDVTDGTVVWRYIDPVRNELYIVNDGSAAIYLGFDNPAVTNQGIRINGLGGSYSKVSDATLGSVYAISDASTNKVGVQLKR